MLKYLITFVVSAIIFAAIFKTQIYFKSKNKKDDDKKNPTVKDYIIRIVLPSIIITAAMAFFEDSITLPPWLGGEATEPILEGDYFERKGVPTVDE